MKIDNVDDDDDDEEETKGKAWGQKNKEGFFFWLLKS